MNKNSLVVSIFWLFCIFIIPCDAMNVKKLFCVTQNILKKQQIRKHNIEHILKFYSEKIKNFKNNDVAAKAVKSLFEQANLGQQRRFLRELDNYYIMNEFRRESYRLQDSSASWTLYKVFAECMDTFNENAQKNKIPFYEKIIVHSEQSTVLTKTTDGWMNCPYYTDNWKNGKIEYRIVRLITDLNYCERIKKDPEEDPSKGNPPY